MLDEIYQKYADEQAFLRKPFPLFCVQVAYWIFFQPNLLVYYRTLSADLKRRDVSDYPEIILKALFLDGSYNSYLITHTTGYRLQRAVDCILMTVIMLFIMIPFLVVMIGLLPYFSHISPIVRSFSSF